MITGLFKLVFNLIRLAILLAIFVLIFHTWTIKQVLKLSLSWSLGSEVAIESVKMDWKNTGFEIHGLEIANPDKFPAGLLADIPLLIVSVDTSALSQGRLHLKTVGLNLRELVVVHDPKYGLNVMALKPLSKEAVEGDGSRSSAAVKRQISERMPKPKIDELIVSVGNITFIENFGKIEKKIRVGINGATFYNLEGTDDITYLVVTLALRKLGYRLLNDQTQQFLGGGANHSGPISFFDRIKKAMTE